jgi:hypothetical protein
MRRGTTGGFATDEQSQRLTQYRHVQRFVRVRTAVEVVQEHVVQVFEHPLHERN